MLAIINQNGYVYAYLTAVLLWFEGYLTRGKGEKERDRDGRKMKIRMEHIPNRAAV